MRSHLRPVLTLLVGVVACGRGNYTLDVAVSGDGATSPAAGSHSYPQGTLVQVTATPAQGATFTGWSGAASGTKRTVTVEMSANRSLRAVFGGAPSDGSSSGGTQSSYLLAVTVAGNGATDPAAGAHSYPAGTQLTLTASPAAGATFRGWSGSVTSTDTRITLVMSENRFLTATFAGGPSSSSGGSARSSSGAGSSTSGGASRSGSSGTASGGGSSGAGGACDAGTSSTAWATSCPASPPPCTAGTWVAGGPDPDHAGFGLLAESAHFAVYSDESPSGVQAAVDYLETVWSTYFGSPIYLREPLCSASVKAKVSIHVHGDWGLTGGSWASGRMGMWIGAGGLADHWGLAHELVHGVQSVEGGMSCDGADTCGWIHESDANWRPQQLDEFHQKELHCSEMLANAPHLYLGSTRDRYCNWQFLEFLKDRYCFSAANAIWTGPPTADPFTAIMNGMGWSLSQLNDFLGEWAMHNVTWDYQDPPPQKTAGTNQGGLYRARYGSITDTSSTERRLRLTKLEPLGDGWATSRRFQSPYHWAPQRWGYNVVRLVPDPGATSVTVTFRGVLQAQASTDFRWGLVATDGAITRPRYSALQRGTDGQLTFCVDPGEALFLVVMGTPSARQQIVWDQPYSTIYRYPYLIQLANAWPEGFQGGSQASCPSGTTRVANGGGCGPSSLPASVYVGPYAQVLGGSVTGTARIEDHATVVSGAVSSGRIGAMSIVGTQGGPGGGNGFDVTTSGEVRTTFYPLGYFESGQGLSGSASLVGDVEYRGQGTRRSSGVCSGFVDASTCVNGAEVTAPPPYTWR